MNNQTDDDGWWRFLELCCQVTSPKAFDEFFSLFLTHDEKSDVAARYMIVKELLKGDMSQREMAERLQVSIAKITRGSNGLKIVSDNMKAFLEEHMS